MEVNISQESQGFVLIFSCQDSDMSDIKLTYFNARGRAETSRLILAYAGKQYIDERITPWRIDAGKNTIDLMISVN